MIWSKKMNIITKLKSTALIATMLVLSTTVTMAKSHGHRNNHVSQAHYNDNSHHQHERGHYNKHGHHHKEHRHYNKHGHHHDKHRHYNKHGRHYEKHAYNRRHHYHDYQPAGILLGIQSGNFTFLLRD
jgi:hypothetical protein